MAVLNKDIHLTAQFLIFLRASYYGQITFHNAMKKLQSTLLPDSYTDICHKAFDKLDPCSTLLELLQLLLFACTSHRRVIGAHL